MDNEASELMAIKGESIRNQEAYKKSESILVEMIGKVLRERKPHKIHFFITPRGKLDCSIYVFKGLEDEFRIIGASDDGVS